MKNFNIRAIVQSKDAKRCELSTMPIAEKLRMLDALRERTIALRLASHQVTNQTTLENK